jgi:hypothetical protein
MAMEDPPQCAHSKAAQARFFIDGQNNEFLIEMFHVLHMWRLQSLNVNEAMLSMLVSIRSPLSQ